MIALILFLFSFLILPFGSQLEASHTGESGPAQGTIVREPEVSEGERERPGPQPTSAGPVLYEANTTVLESEEHGPMLCLGGMMDSYPPQCGDVPVDGWDWDAVKGEERADGTTWGTYYVRGTYEDGRFGVVRAGGFRNEPSRDDYDFSPACDEPWATPDPGKTSNEDFEAAVTYSNKARDVSAVWVSYLDKDDPPEQRDEELLNAAFTGRLGHHEAEIRERWGGPLCVVRYEVPRRRLLRIQTGLSGPVADELGYQMLSSSVDEVGSRVEMEVVILTAELEAELERRYGGLVEAWGALQPVDQRSPGGRDRGDLG